MKKQIGLFAAVLLVAMGVRAFGDYSATQGSGSTVFAFVCSTTKICPASVPINSSNTEIFTASTPAQVSLANTGSNATALNVAQATAASLNATVVGTGTFATQSAATVADGADVAEGAKADAACGTDNGTCSVTALIKRNNQNLTTINTSVNSSVAAGTNRIGYVSDDPCTQLTKTNAAIATSSGTVQLVAPSGSTQVYVCSFSLIAAATAVVNLVGGTGATCTTGTPVAALGSTTAANGMSLAANGGLTFGNGGATVVRTTTGGHGLCLIQSGTTALAGNITYVQQ